MKEVKCEKCAALSARYHAAFNMLKKYRDHCAAATALELEIRAFMVAEDNKAHIKEPEEPTIKTLASALKKLGISDQILRLIEEASKPEPARVAVPLPEQQP